MVKFYAVASAATAAMTGVENVERVMVVRRMASNLDDLRERLGRDARELTRKFSEYAARLDEGFVFSPPAVVSTMDDLFIAQAKFESLYEAFKDVFHLLTGRKFREVYAELDEGGEGPRTSSGSSSSGKLPIVRSSRG
jgi:hypothetical protein